jgi:hypothetical protein
VDAEQIQSVTPNPPRRNPRRVFYCRDARMRSGARAGWLTRLPADAGGHITMKLKLDEQGHVVVQNGMPVYVHADGKELPFDAAQTVSTISRLNGEAKGHRERAEAAETKAKLFEGIEDPEAAKKALETIANIDQGKLLSAGKVEEIKAAARIAAEEQVKAATKSLAEQLQTSKTENQKLGTLLNNEMIGGSFTRSKFITEKVAIPADLLQSKFGSNFKIEDGKVIAYDNSGNRIFSRTRHGEVADFDEAIEIIVDQYPQRDSILKGDVKGGSGSSQGGGGGGGGGGKQKTRQQWDSMDHNERMAFTKAGGKVV